MQQIEEASSVSLNDMSPDLVRDIISLIHNITDSDYLTKFNTSSELGEALQQLVNKLNNKSTNDLDNLVNISISNNEASISSAQLLYALKNVEAFSQQIAAAAEEMQASVKEVKNYSDNIDYGTTNSLSKAKEVADILTNAVQAFTNIQQSVVENSAKLGALSNFTKQIKDIAEQIKAIAFQSKILAMNSSVEAARAGDHGRGFSVIGQEIHLLSNKSEDAIAKIAQLISGYESEIKEITSSLSNSQMIVGEGQSSISSANQNMVHMIDEFEKVSGNTSQISEALAEQTKAASDVAKGINRIAIHASKSVESSDAIVEAINGIQSQIDQQVVEFEKVNISGKIIKLAKSDHVIWKKRLVNMIAGKEGLQSTELADHHSCRLGKWYDKVTDSSLKEHAGFKNLLEPHKLVHAHGKKAVDYYNDGNIGAALNEIKEVEKESEKVLRLLTILESV